jgi:hypothetical protein
MILPAILGFFVLFCLMLVFRVKDINNYPQLGIPIVIQCYGFAGPDPQHNAVETTFFSVSVRKIAYFAALHHAFKNKKLYRRKLLSFISYMNILCSFHIFYQGHWEIGFTSL